MITRRVFLAITAAPFMSACQHVEPQGGIGNVTNTMRRLDGGGDRLRVGVVYALNEDSRTNLVLDLAASRSLNESTGELRDVRLTNASTIVLEKMRVDETGGPCKPSSGRFTLFSGGGCDSQSFVIIELHPESVIRREMMDPFEFLELLNRPVTGLQYNREAEIRIMQWRTTLAAAGPQNRLYVCTSVDTMFSGEVVVRGKLSVEKAGEVVRSIASSGVLQIPDQIPRTKTIGESSEYRFSVENAVQLTAVLREIGLVQSSTNPRIDFTLGGFRSLAAVAYK